MSPSFAKRETFSCPFPSPALAFHRRLLLSIGSLISREKRDFDFVSTLEVRSTRSAELLSSSLSSLDHSIPNSKMEGELSRISQLAQKDKASLSHSPLLSQIISSSQTRSPTSLSPLNSPPPIPYSSPIPSRLRPLRSHKI